jgi:hypothetical protein
MPSIVLGESATLEIALRSHLAGALDLSALRLSASDPSLSTTLSSLPPDASATTPATTLAAAAGAPLHLEAGGVMVVRFTYSPKVAAVVSLLSLSVQLGLEPCAIILSIPVVAPADEAAPDGTPDAGAAAAPQQSQSGTEHTHLLELDPWGDEVVMTWHPLTDASSATAGAASGRMLRSAETAMVQGLLALAGASVLTGAMMRAMAMAIEL